MLRRLGQGRCSNGSTLGVLLRCRRSTPVGARSISCRIAGSGGGGDVEEREPSAPPAAAAGPRWAMLNSLVYGMDESIVADAKTVADCRTSWGQQLRVALSLAPPPESSFLCYDYDWTGSAKTVLFLRDLEVRLIAAHGDSILLQTCRHANGAEFDYFVYSAGAATRPPSLSQLPARDVPTEVERRMKDYRLKPRDRLLYQQNTGLLRRGEEDELLVAQLELTPSRRRPRAPADTFLAEVCVHRVGRSGWELTRPAAPILLGKGDELMAPWQHIGGKVFPVGDRFPCWVDYFYDSASILLCDMAEAAVECPKLRLLPLPVVPPPRWFSCYHSQDMSEAGDGADAVIRLVNIGPRCCCGGPGLSNCARSPAPDFKFMVTTWTLALGTRTDDWVQDASVDCEELWALPGYEGLPRVHPEYPVVSLVNPDVVCFGVGDTKSDNCLKWKQWMVEVDVRKKALLSVIRCCLMASHFPIKLQ